MGKVLYSLILEEEIVREIDKLAFLTGRSRSSMINQILAERVNIVTPERRIKNTFDLLKNMILGSRDLYLDSDSSEQVMSIKSALEYKYRPTIKYSLELYKERSESIGEFKMSVRTQSEELLQKIRDFLGLYIQIERVYLSEYFPEKVIYHSIEDNKFVRKFLLDGDKDYTDEKESKILYDYVETFDDMLKGYLSGKYNSMESLENRYIKYLGSGEIV